MTLADRVVVRREAPPPGLLPGVACVAHVPAAGERQVASSDSQPRFRRLKAAIRSLAAIVSCAAASNDASDGGARLQALLHFDSSIFRPSPLAAKV